MRYLLWLVSRWALALRYSIHVHGAEQLVGFKGPVLVLPNHPAYIDPVLLLSTTWRTLHPRPMLYEGNFRSPLLYPLTKLLRAVPVPDLSYASVQAREQTQQAVATVIEGLRRGENFVLWPAGHVQHDGVERLGGARSRRGYPQRRARDRGRPGPHVRSLGEPVQLCLHGQKTAPRPQAVPGGRMAPGEPARLHAVLAAGWRSPYSTSKRNSLPELRREPLNPWLEAWYNSRERETPTYVPYHFLFGPRTYEFPKARSLAEADLTR